MRGIPSKTRRRSSPREHELTVRLSSDELERVRNIATQAGYSMSEYARSFLLSKATTLEIKAPTIPHRRKSSTTIDPSLIYQLARIGNNLNQLARRVNSSGMEGYQIQIIAHLITIERTLFSFLLPNSWSGTKKKEKSGSRKEEIDRFPSLLHGNTEFFSPEPFDAH